jgi:hypothetical protein
MNGFHVCAFTDPIEAFNKIKKSLKEYALIISDFKMPLRMEMSSASRS